MIRMKGASFVWEAGRLSGGGHAITVVDKENNLTKQMGILGPVIIAVALVRNRIKYFDGR